MADLCNFQEMLQNLQDLEEMEQEELIRDRDRRRRRPRPRIFRERLDPFRRYSESEFIKRYRLSKQTVRYLVNLIRADLEPQRRSQYFINPELQTLIACRFYAKGGYQSEIGDMHGVSQSSISRIVKRVSEAIGRKVPEIVKFPDDLENVKKQFYGKKGFPGVVGCIDCTHVKIKNPDGQNPLLHWCRKGFYSLNVQLICGPDTKIYNVVSRWRGSTNDARIFQESQVQTEFESGRLHGILLGDGGYPCAPYLMTPLGNPQNMAEERYNEAHKGTRVVVECLNGRWKGMFRSLRKGMEIHRDTAKTAIAAMAALYNLRLEMDRNIPQAMDDNAPVLNPNLNISGHRFRQQIIDTYFN